MSLPLNYYMKSYELWSWCANTRIMNLSICSVCEHDERTAIFPAVCNVFNGQYNCQALKLRVNLSKDHQHRMRTTSTSRVMNNKLRLTNSKWKQHNYPTSRWVDRMFEHTEYRSLHGPPKRSYHAFPVRGIFVNKAVAWLLNPRVFPQCFR